MMMTNLDIFKAILAFVGVSFDEFVVLILFFSRTHSLNSSWTTLQIVVGHSMAFIAVVGISLIVGLLGGFIIPVELLGLLGIVPLWLGFHDLKKRIPRFFPNWRSTICCGYCGSNSNVDTNTRNPSQYTALSTQSTQSGEYGAIPTKDVELASSNHGANTVNRGENREEEINNTSAETSFWGHFCHKNVWIVFGSGLSEGSEEVAVFSALFSMLVQRDATAVHSSISAWRSSSLLLTIVILFVCLAIQLFVAFLIASSCARHMAENKNGEKSNWEIALKLGAPALLVVLGIAVLEETVRYIINY